MKGKFWMGLLLVCVAAAPADAQPWARKMFSTTEHDFGTVARGSKAEFAFELQNVYEEEVHIAAVRTSCGCTKPQIINPTLKTWEKGSILAVFNTRSFLGQRSATITVTIDRPYYAEVQLRVQGHVRSDVVFDPGAVQFGQVNAGTMVERKVQVAYAGREDWQILDVRSANPDFEVELTNERRGGGRVYYDMLVRLKPTAPPGYIQEELTVVSNDERTGNLPLAVEGQIVSALTVSPASLFLGVVPAGQTVTKKLILRGQTPFHVVDVKCPDGCFAFDVPKEAKEIHVIPVRFTAPATAGRLAEKIRITTDIGEGQTVECEATATVE